MSAAREKPPKKQEPYAWTQGKGMLNMTKLRHYARWLFPQLGRKWQAEGVKDFTLPAGDEKKPSDIYTFPKSAGPVMGRHLLHFGKYVLEALLPYSDKEPYAWPKRQGLIMIPHLKHLHEHVLMLLKKKRKAL